MKGGLCHKLSPYIVGGGQPNTLFCNRHFVWFCVNPTHCPFLATATRKKHFVCFVAQPRKHCFSAVTTTKKHPVCLFCANPNHCSFAATTTKKPLVCLTHQAVTLKKEVSLEKLYHDVWCTMKCFIRYSVAVPFIRYSVCCTIQCIQRAYKG